MWLAPPSGEQVSPSLLVAREETSWSVIATHFAEWALVMLCRKTWGMLGLDFADKLS